MNLEDKEWFQGSITSKKASNMFKTKNLMKYFSVVSPTIGMDASDMVA
jgi:hypothetical protein